MDQATDILARIATLHPKAIDLELSRLERLLAALDHPEKRLPPVFHVAGTNGKGSTIATLRAVLEADGKLVHAYTSPHLVNFNERIRLGREGGGRFVSNEQLSEALLHCEEANKGQDITFFEITTAVALYLFAENPADFTLLEVGLGGRLDATNVIPAPLASIITPISIDHRDYLGDTVEKIAAEKAGIIKKGAACVSSPQPADAMRALDYKTRREETTLFVGGRDWSAHEEQGRMIYQDEDGLLDLPLPRLPGRHQITNAATAIAAMRRVNVLPEPAIVAKGLEAITWPARVQRLHGALQELAGNDAELWLDGGHNAAAGEALAEAMADIEERVSKPLVLIVGMLATKETDAFMSAFRGLAARIITVAIDGHEKCRTPEELAAIAEGLGFEARTSASLEAAIREARQGYDEAPRILIAGSLYLAGVALARDGSAPE